MSLTISLKLLDEWLILKALQKAASSYDNWNYNMFRPWLTQKIHNAQRTSLNMYLFNDTNGKMIDVADMKKELKTLRLEIKN